VSDDIVEFIKTQLDEDEAAVKAMGVEQHGRWWASQRIDGSFDPEGTTVYFDVRRSDGLGYMHLGAPGMLAGPTAVHIARHDPVRVLADVEAKRAILAEVMSWGHTYIDGDTWFSCAQAASAFDEDGTPGSGCADDDRAGGPCDCGLDRRRATFLYALAAPYAGRPGFKPEWRLT